MATISENRIGTDLESKFAVSETEYPGRSVDSLLEQGKIEAAREEFERLCLEGLESGDAIGMTPARWDEMRLELHAEAKLNS
jgi:hypothetical protein